MIISKLSGIKPQRGRTRYSRVHRVNESYAMLGKCNCGNVSFELTEPVAAMYKCYCILCQKQSGNASNAATIVKNEIFRWLSGVDSVTVWKKNTGFNAHFCSRCGCPVPNPLGDGFMWVPMGLLQNADIPTVVHLFLETRRLWDLPGNCDGLIEGGGNVERLYEALESHRST